MGSHSGGCASRGLTQWDTRQVSVKVTSKKRRKRKVISQLGRKERQGKVRSNTHNRGEPGAVEAAERA